MPIDKLKLLAMVDQLREAILTMADEPVTPPVVVPPAKPITSVWIENTGGAQTNVPFTFGQVFAVGHFKPEQGLEGALANDRIPLQVDVKALHADGSVRHAIVSGILPTLFKDEKRELALVPTAVEVVTGFETTANPLSAVVGLTVGGIKYTASAASIPFSVGRWINGVIVREYTISLPLRDPQAEVHPHLAVRAGLRVYANGRTRVEVIIENNWAYEPGPQNFTYDVAIEAGGKTVFEQKGLVHYHHARWRKVFWNGDAPQIHIRHSPRYLIDSMALPNYDPTVVVSEKLLVAMSKEWESVKNVPMGVGLAARAMPTTGGRRDIGLQPGWAVAWLLSQDPRAAVASLGTADLAGSWSMHYRDKDTDKPISLLDYPYMTIVGNPGDTGNPITKKREQFPARDKLLSATPYQHDISHQPNLAYMPYLLTGEHYYLEELQFWAMYDVFSSNPGYRENIKGLLKPEQVRGQAWALRTLAEAAYITPDDDRLKAHFLRILDSNLDWYNAEYTDNPKANDLGFIANGYAVVYNGNRGIGPWQDDFFTQAVGRVAELGFEKATKLLKWKAKFPISRMVGAGACFVHGAMYSMNVRDAPASPFYKTIGEAFKATIEPAIYDLPCGSEALAKALKLKPGEMTGYSNGTEGYPSNMQPALAYAADVGGEDGKRAWQVFMSRTVKPDYGTGAQFAIVPRTV